MSSFWKNKKVVVTGGTGFIGSHLVELLLSHQADVTVVTSTGHTENIKPIRKDIRLVSADLTNEASAKKVFKNQDIVLHLAAVVAGIQYNRIHPANMLHDNIMLNQSVLHAAAQAGVKQMLVTSSACVYPRKCPQPIKEKSGFVDSPEPTNSGYGWSKRFSEVAARAIIEEYGMKIAIARPFNAYGPRDHFDPAISHVIPGIIKRVFDGENPLIVWGTGKQTRSFIYVTDLARGLLEITEKYAVGDPVNIGSPEEVSMADLAKLIIKSSGLATKIVFDTTKPDGQPKRSSDVTLAKVKFGFKATVSLKEGIEKTIAWYRKTYRV
jgi:GDP-L-fucose synthase